MTVHGKKKLIAQHFRNSDTRKLHFDMLEGPIHAHRITVHANKKYLKITDRSINRHTKTTLHLLLNNVKQGKLASVY